MKMKSPLFWNHFGIGAVLLGPAAWAFQGVAGVRNALAAPPWRASIPVVCIGNLVIGGAGKTPVAIDIARRLLRRGVDAHFLSRGYGGSARGPLRVDPMIHSAPLTGDEPLLLANVAPTWVSSDRPAGGRAAIDAEAQVIVMDDGFQNPSLAKDLSLLVIDGGYGLGNGHVFPAGPLRESVSSALSRANAVVIVGEDKTGVTTRLGEQCEVLRADLVPTQEGDELRGQTVVAFAGIGRPEKFFSTLRKLGCEIVEAQAFADHHPYTDAELTQLREAAARTSARLVTTEKDWVRIAPAAREGIIHLPVAIRWSDEATIDSHLETLMAPP